VDVEDVDVARSQGPPDRSGVIDEQVWMRTDRPGPEDERVDVGEVDATASFVP
jgi:hypothetical protein